MYKRGQMSTGVIEELLQLWTASALKHGDTGPFGSAKELLETIDRTKLGSVRWQSFTMSFDGDRPQQDTPPWMTGKYDVWFRDPQVVVDNLLGESSFDGELDYGPYRMFDSSGHRVLKDFMSGDWAYRQAVSLTSE